MIRMRKISIALTGLFALSAIFVALPAFADDDAASAEAATASIHASGCLLWNLGGHWTLAYDPQASTGDIGRDLANANLPPRMELQQAGTQLRGSITYPQILSDTPRATGSVIGTISGDTFEITATWRYTENSNFNFEQATIYDGQITRDGVVSGIFYFKNQGPGQAANWHSERVAACKSSPTSLYESKQDHSALTQPDLPPGLVNKFDDQRQASAVLAAAATSTPPPIALGRAAPRGPVDPSKTMCDYARSAKARNSPTAPALEKRCLEGGGSMTPPPPPPPVAAPDLDALAAVGAAIAAQDPAVAEARNAEAGAFYQLGFDIASGLFGDPALGSAGNTVMGPGSEAIRNSLSAAGQRGFNASVAFHQSRDYKH